MRWMSQRYANRSLVNSLIAVCLLHESAGQGMSVLYKRDFKLSGMNDGNRWSSWFHMIRLRPSISSCTLSNLIPWSESLRCVWYSWFQNNGCKNFETECKCFHILQLISRFYQSACVASGKAAFSDFSQCGREVSVGHIAILQGKPSKLYPCHYKTSFVLTRVTCRLLAQRSDKSQFAGRKRRKRTLIAWTFSDYDNWELW